MSNASGQNKASRLVMAVRFFSSERSVANGSAPSRVQPQARATVAGNRSNRTAMRTRGEAASPRRTRCLFKASETPSVHYKDPRGFAVKFFPLPHPSPKKSTSSTVFCTSHLSFSTQRSRATITNSTSQSALSNQRTTMSYSYYHTRERERSPYETESYFSRPLVRRNSKRQHIDIYDDDEYDDYPRYSSSSKPSRALTIRRPGELQKYNVFNDRSNEAEDDHHSHRYKKVHKYYVSRPSESDDEREFRLKVKTTLSRPKSSHADKPMSWSGDVFKRREKWVGTEWESRERERGDSFWDDEPVLKERTVKYRKMKRTRTDEWKPLSGWKRY